MLATPPNNGPAPFAHTHTHTHTQQGMDSPRDSLEDESVSTQQVLSQLEDGETGQCLYLLTGRSQEGLQLTACQGTCTWAAELTSSDLRSLAKAVNIPPEEFERETERALTGKPRATETFAYSVTRKSADIQLTWKRHLIPENIRFQLGSVLLQCKEADKTLSVILDHAVTTAHSLQEKIADLERENLRLLQERRVALERLEQSTLTKEEVERELFSKFKLVLNEKKNKIRRLMDGLVSSEEPVGAGKRGDTAAGAGGGQPTSTAADQSPPHPSMKSALLGEADETVSPPKRRRKRQTRSKAKEPQIPRPPAISSAHTPQKTRQNSNSSADGDDLLNML